MSAILNLACFHEQRYHILSIKWYHTDFKEDKTHKEMAQKLLVKPGFAPKLSVDIKIRVWYKK